MPGAVDIRRRLGVVVWRHSVVVRRGLIGLIFSWSSSFLGLEFLCCCCYVEVVVVDVLVQVVLDDVRLQFHRPVFIYTCTTPPPLFIYSIEDLYSCFYFCGLGAVRKLLWPC